MITGWVLFGYAASYGAILAYLLWMVLRIRSLRHDLTSQR